MSRFDNPPSMPEPLRPPPRIGPKDLAETAVLAQAMGWFTEVYVDRAHDQTGPYWILAVRWQDESGDQAKEFRSPHAFWHFLETLSTPKRG